jgi:type IX secretion system PorP/SprF family membrane protein
LYNDRSGDGNLTNMSVLGSVAYHLALDNDSKTKLSLGMQGGYTQKSIDLARLYFADEFFNGGFQPGTTGELLNPKTDYFTANVGMSWRHQIHDKVSYFLGASAFNLNQPKETLLRKANNQVGLGLRASGQFGLTWQATDRLMIAPAVLYQTQTAATEMIAGSEFLYTIGDLYTPVIAPKFFIGAYTRLNDALLANVGLEWQGFRLGVAYDYNTSSLKTASNGNGGFEIAIQYIKPGALDKFHTASFPCRRF